MFQNNDKLSLTLINARDINGKIIPYQLTLPLTCNEYDLPQNLSSIDVFEYHEGLINAGNIVFSIYIGEITSIEELINKNIINNVKILKNIEIKSIDEPICIQEVIGKKVVFATIKEQDIVVRNQEQLISVIEKLSNDLSVIKNSVANIKTLSKTLNRR